MYKNTELQVKKAPSYKILFKVFFEANKKSIILTSIISFLIITSATTLVMTWHSNQYKTMINYFEQNNWNNDYELSAYSEYDEGSSPDYYSLDIILDTMKKDVNKIIPDIIHQQSSGLYSLEFYSTTNKPYEVCIFTDEINNLLNESITVGRMPQTYNEIIYLQKGNVSLYQLNDVITLETSGRYPIAVNFTITGIIENIDDILYQEGYSKDILRWGWIVRNRNFSFENKYTFEAMFYTSETFFEEIFLLDIHPNNAIIFDLYYDITKIKLNCFKKYINYFDNIYTYHPFRNDEGKSIGIGFNPFRDLSDKLESFNSIIRKETLRMIIYFLPIMTILMFTLLEGINYSKKTIHSSFWLMKSQGVEEEHLFRIVKLKAIYLNLIIGGVGIILSVILGSVILVPLNSEITIVKYLSGLINPLLLYILILTINFVILIEYTILRNHLKNTQVIRSERYTVKQKKSLRQILLKEEVLLFLFGLLFFSLGYVGLVLLYFPDTVLSDPFRNYQNSYTIFWTLFLTGVFFLSISIILLVVKLIVVISQKISKISWKNHKNFLSLSLKSSNHNFSIFKNLLIILLLSGITLYPGIMNGKSSNENVRIETNLALGCSDILVLNWNYDETLKKGIEALPTIQNTAEVTKYHCSSFSLSFLKSRFCNLDILSLHNLTEFNQVVNFSRINSEELYEAINLLQEPQSFLVNNNFAKRNNYFEDLEIYNTRFMHPENKILLNYAGSYNSFPLLTQTNGYPFDVFNPSYNLVMSQTTVQLLQEINYLSVTQDFLLIRTNTTNTDFIKQLLIENYDLNVKISNDISNELDIFNLEYRKNLLLSITILTSSILLLLGFIIASNSYQNNIQGIAAAYRVGATKRQLIINHLLEIQMVISIPIILSAVGGFFLQKSLASFLYDSLIPYNPIELWLPYWLISVVLLIEIIYLLLGWSLKFYYDLKSYHPIKQE